MSKLKFTIMSSFVVILTIALMGGFFAMNLNYTYSLPNENTTNYTDKVTINNIEVINKVDPSRVDGPNIVGDSINLDLDLDPGEVYSFRYDLINSSTYDFELSDYITSCIGIDNIQDYISVDVLFENGDVVGKNTLIPSKTKRIIYVTIKYDKNLSDTQSFKLNFDMSFIKR